MLLMLATQKNNKCSNQLFWGVIRVTCRRSLCAISTDNSSDKEECETLSKIGQRSYDNRIEKEKIHCDMATLLSHAGLSSENRALSPPLELASTFERSPNGEYPPGEFIYGRMGNPTRQALESVISKLEMTSAPSNNGKADSNYDNTPASCSAFSSGMAAISSIILAHPKCVILLPDDCYHGVPSQLVTVLNMHGIEHRTVDMSCKQNVKIVLEDTVRYQRKCKALSKSKDLSEDLMDEFGVILWIETPSNPLVKVTDIAELVNMVKCNFNALTKLEDNIAVTIAVDSTWSPPCLTQPLLVSSL